MNLFYVTGQNFTLIKFRKSITDFLMLIICDVTKLNTWQKIVQFYRNGNIIVQKKLCTKIDFNHLKLGVILLHAKI